MYGNGRCVLNHSKTYTPLQKKRNTRFRSPHDPSLGPAPPRGQKVILAGILEPGLKSRKLPLLTTFCPYKGVHPKLGSWEVLDQVSNTLKATSILLKSFSYSYGGLKEFKSQFKSQILTSQCRTKRRYETKAFSCVLAWYIMYGNSRCRLGGNQYMHACRRPTYRTQ